MNPAEYPAELYEQRAVECFLLADELHDLHERQIMHELGLCWLRLAARANENQQQAESQDRAAPKSSLPFPAPQKHMIS